FRMNVRSDSFTRFRYDSKWMSIIELMKKSGYIEWFPEPCPIQSVRWSGRHIPLLFHTVHPSTQSAYSWIFISNQKI
ncbi:MAG TPA: hypothetical protein VFE04_11545, partial [Puia sp.]|nr:hypothetical protein [Puia sp.]